jgi:hypothetical protein
MKREREEKERLIIEGEDEVTAAKIAGENAYLKLLFAKTYGSDNYNELTDKALQNWIENNRSLCNDD